MIPPSEQAVIEGARWKALLLSFGAAAFVAGGGWLLTQPEGTTQLVGLLSMLFFGACLVVVAVQLIRPARVILEKDGFSIRNPPYKTRRVDWDDVEGFFVWKHQHTKLVAFNYLEGRAPDTMVTKLNQNFGCDGALPAILKGKTEEIVLTMEAWKARAQATS